MKHTAEPWYISEDNRKIMAKNSNPQAQDLVISNLTAIDIDNAEFIVRAVNSHDKLVKALEECKHWHQGDKWRGSDDADQKGAWNRHMAIINEALAAAKGE